MRKCTAEAIGTFWLTFAGCGSAVIASSFPDVGIGLLGVSLAFGLTVLTMAYSIGHISGCHQTRQRSFPDELRSPIHAKLQPADGNGRRHRSGAVAIRALIDGDPQCGLMSSGGRPYAPAGLHR